MNATASPAPVATLRADALQVALGGQAVLHGVSFALRPGWTAIVGPNGAGKSTLLRALAGLLPLASGRVWLDERPLPQWRSVERARRIAWLAQQGESSGDLSVRDVVMLGRLPHLGLFGSPGAGDHAAVDAALGATGCADWQQRRLPDLSGGERQRVLLARALAVHKHFPPMLIHMIRAGEVTGELPAMLNRAANVQEQDLERRAMTIAGLLEPALILAMGVVVLLIVLAVLMPIIEINQLVR